MAKIIVVFLFSFFASVSPTLADETIATATAGTPVITVKGQSAEVTEFLLMEIPLGDKVTSQSSTAHDGIASKAVDGNTAGHFNDHDTCTHTDHERERPWWAVDLGMSMCIGKVVIYNRVDPCRCGDRLFDATVRIGVDTSYKNNPECESRVSDEQIQKSHIIEINCNLTGRYLSIDIPRNDGILTLCEVKAYMAQTCANASDIIIKAASSSTNSTPTTGPGSTTTTTTRPGVIQSTDAIDPVECYRESDGSDYRGRVSTTENGLTCQKWTSQYPHTHRRTPEKFPDAGLGDHNFCRNPDRSTSPWCFTTDIRFRWFACDVGEPRDVCPGISAISPNPSLSNRSVGFKNNRTALWHLIAFSLLIIPTTFFFLFD